MERYKDKLRPQKKRPSGTWTLNFIPPTPEGSYNLPRVYTSMLNLELPGNLNLSHETIIQEFEFRIFFVDGYNVLQFQRAKEFPTAPTDHLINVLYYTSIDKRDFQSYAFGNLIRTELNKRQVQGEYIELIYIKIEDPDDDAS